MIWQIIDAGMATLEELETTWSLDDLSRAAGYISMKNEVERRLMEAAKKKVENA